MSPGLEPQPKAIPFVPWVGGGLWTVERVGDDPCAPARPAPPIRRWRARSAPLLATAGLLSVLAACAPPPLRREPTAPAAPTHSTLRRPDTVPVGLAAWEGAGRIQVDRGRGGELVLSRAGAVVVDSTGRSGSALEVRAGGESQTLGLGDRRYPGALRFECHPRGGLRVTNRVALADYVAGVVAAELPLWSALPAELEAQAIAARSYAISELARSGGPLRDDTARQAYLGVFQPGPSEGAVRAARRLARAVESTRGVVLASAGRVLDARFHAACGGRPAAFAAVFPGEGHAPLHPVACEPCAEIGERERASASSPAYVLRVAWRWTASASALTELARSLELGPRLVRLEPTRRDPGGRWLEVELAGERAARRLPFEELRARLGAEKLAGSRVRRTWPPAGELIGGGLLFEGLGRGHGVGLCQIGAREYASRGWSAERILAHYFPVAERIRLR